MAYDANVRRVEEFERVPVDAEAAQELLAEVHELEEGPGPGERNVQIPGYAGVALAVGGTDFFAFRGWVLLDGSWRRDNERRVEVKTLLLATDAGSFTARRSLAVATRTSRSGRIGRLLRSCTTRDATG